MNSRRGWHGHLFGPRAGASGENVLRPTTGLKYGINRQAFHQEEIAFLSYLFS